MTIEFDDLWLKLVCTAFKETVRRGSETILDLLNFWFITILESRKKYCLGMEYLFFWGNGFYLQIFLLVSILILFSTHSYSIILMHRHRTLKLHLNLVSILFLCNRYKKIGALWINILQRHFYKLCNNFRLRRITPFTCYEV